MLHSYKSLFISVFTFKINQKKYFIIKFKYLIYMADTSDFKNGAVIKFNNDFYTIVEFQHVKPGKGGAFVRTKLKSITTGRILENTFNAGVKIDFARIERNKYQFLYSSGDDFTFMDMEDFNQVTVDRKMIDNPLYLKEGQEVFLLINFDDNKILGVELPFSIEMKLTEVELAEKGNTATHASKKAITETGLEVQVPLFINEGDIIKIDTRDGKYIERVNK